MEAEIDDDEEEEEESESEDENGMLTSRSNRSRRGEEMHGHREQDFNRSTLSRRIRERVAVVSEAQKQNKASKKKETLVSHGAAQPWATPSSSQSSSALSSPGPLTPVPSSPLQSRPL